MALNRVKLGLKVTFMKYLTSVVSLIFLPKTLIWNKIRLRLSNLLNLAELVVNISFFTRLITDSCKDFRILRLKNEITFQKSLSI